MPHLAAHRSNKETGHATRRQIEVFEQAAQAGAPHRGRLRAPRRFGGRSGTARVGHGEQGARRGPRRRLGRRGEQGVLSPRRPQRRGEPSRRGPLARLVLIVFLVEVAFTLVVEPQPCGRRFVPRGWRRRPRPRAGFVVHVAPRRRRQPGPCPQPLDQRFEPLNGGARIASRRTLAARFRSGEIERGGSRATRPCAARLQPWLAPHHQRSSNRSAPLSFREIEPCP